MLKSGKKSGYTLVEVLVASTIFISVVAIGMATYSSAAGFRSKSQVMREVNQSARFALDSMAQDVRNANGNVTIPGSPAKDIVGYALIGDSGELIETNITEANSVKTLRIYQKPEKSVCDIAGAVKEITYRFATEKLFQDIIYKDSVTNSELALIDQCKKSQNNQLLPTSIKVDSLKFYGISSIKGNLLTTQAPYVTMSLLISPANTDSAVSNESAQAELRTTVTLGSGY